ncbi:Crp/Fnr family transcriptional regulator [Paenibacillus alginolyticus]|uniref:Crp/Fnr family transcriptional regulator n=1 Tax=Paenibacillus alginolyticus TaxID=59839 RepID=A0ABT4GLS7_9BACL|nr:Crp/Fnr family transcriptional regulator [Paenibacillus alginolyticus]MCY9669629.1 Crp/Fnr family transcriptional regulator [Paenibacillus alginolyticus]MCY9697163.1 Crp/Fnr family transcriptional regulator [Paenibacillus alginolyticus]MEC0145352.1 Crp/Fnr family transcriptional regulator [Paenibacillus alginolyticus]
MMDKLWYLSKISIFEALPEEDLLELDRMAPMTHFNALPKDTLIQTPDTYRDGLFFIKEGKLRLYKINVEGKQFTVGILGKGNMFGEIDTFSFGTKGIYIETMEETLICSVPKEHFENFLAKRPQLAMKFLTELSKMLRERDEMLEKLALGDVRERVLHLLLKLSEKFGVEDGGLVKIDLPITHQEVAHMIGATREAVTVILNELMKEGMIRTGRKSISIHQSKAKECLALGCKK